MSHIRKFEIPACGMLLTIIVLIQDLLTYTFVRDLSNEAQLRCMMVKAVPFPQTLELFYSFYNFCFSPFTEALQVRDMTMCDSSWSVFFMLLFAHIKLKP